LGTPNAWIPDKGMIHFAGESGISSCGFCGFEADRSAKLASDLEIGFLRSSNPFFGRI